MRQPSFLVLRQPSKLVLVVTSPTSLLPTLLSCGTAAGVPVDVLRADEVLAGIEIGCAGVSVDPTNRVAVVATGDAGTVPFVPCASPVPPPLAWCGAYSSSLYDR